MIFPAKTWRTERQPQHPGLKTRLGSVFDCSCSPGIWETAAFTILTNQKLVSAFVAIVLKHLLCFRNLHPVPSMSLVRIDFLFVSLNVREKRKQTYWIKNTGKKNKHQKPNKWTKRKNHNKKNNIKIIFHSPTKLDGLTPFSPTWVYKTVFATCSDFQNVFFFLIVILEFVCVVVNLKSKQSDCAFHLIGKY